MDDTIRMEIIAGQALQEDIINELLLMHAMEYYTLIPEVLGVGYSGEKRGDAVWPEKNFILIVYCGEKEALQAKQAIDKIRKRFPEEGVRFFTSPKLA